jgi:hypothetical protein
MLNRAILGTTYSFISFNDLDCFFVSVYLTIAGICAIVGVVATGLFTICAGKSLCLICNNVLAHLSCSVSNFKGTIRGDFTGLKVIPCLD